MEFLNYNDFINESYQYELLNESFSPDTLVVEASRFSGDIDSNIKFGIVMATHKVADDAGLRSAREKHKPQLESFKECLESIKKQSHKNWKVFICADCYDGDDELKEVINEVLDKKDYWYSNLPKPGERTNKTVLDQGLMHKLGGCKAWNTAYEAMIKEGFKHAVKLGHDDVWTPDHLELHAKAYTQYPESKVVWTKTAKKKVNGKTGTTTWPNSQMKNIDYDTITFKEGNTADVYSWEIEPFKSLRWRSTNQTTTAPKRKYYLPGDVDMWSRKGDIIKEKEYKTLFIPKVTYRYRNKFGKLP